MAKLKGSQEVVCPGCRGYLFNFVGLSVHFGLAMPCPGCGHWVFVEEGLVATLVHNPFTQLSAKAHEPTHR